MNEILKLYGTPYENGYTSGRYFSSRVRPDVMKPQMLLKDNPSFQSHVNDFMSALRHDFPVYYEETIGKADGLGIDRTVYCALMCTEAMADHSEHCSTIMVKNKDGSVSLCHNEDDIYEEGNFVIAHVREPDGNTFYTNDMYHMPFGNGFCINSHGLIRTINYCYESPGFHQGLSRYYSQRHIANAASLADLLKRAEESHPASGYHVNLIDSGTGYSIEVHPDTVCVKQLHTLLIHTNHYIHGVDAAHWNSDPAGNSVFRYSRIQQLLEQRQKTDMDTLCDILNDHTDDPMTSVLQCHDIPNQTVFRFMYDGITEQKSLYSFMQDETITFQEGI
ncbi:MAG: C45 family autoproteolytic acyltransferase/hydrolase [Bulleidia sp.]